MMSFASNGRMGPTSDWTTTMPIDNDTPKTPAGMRGQADMRGSTSESPSARMSRRRQTQRSGSLLSPLGERSYRTLSSPMSAASSSPSSNASTFARRTGPHTSLMGTPLTDSQTQANDIQQNLVRQRFRQRCQQVMARDRHRSRAGAIQALRNQSSSSPSHGGTCSDELDGSDVFSDTSPSSFSDEDEEAVRRIMTAEYRRMLRSQELHGSEAIGWLDPDEVAWLEEEMKREESRSQSSTGIEPPPELEDEDEMLADLYEHACSQQGAGNTQAAPSALRDTGGEEDIDWVWDVDLIIDGERDGMDMDR